MEGRVRQQALVPGQRAGLFFLGRGRRLALISGRRCTDQRAQVVEVEAARAQVRGHVKALATGVETHVSGQVTIAYQARDVIHVGSVALAAQVHLDGIRRRIGQHHAEQPVQVRRIRTSDAQARVERLAFGCRADRPYRPG